MKEDVVGIERHVLLMQRYHQPVSFLSFLSFYQQRKFKRHFSGVATYSQVLYEPRVHRTQYDSISIDGSRSQN